MCLKFFFLVLLLKISCRRKPETDWPNPWGSIEHGGRTTGLKEQVTSNLRNKCASHKMKNQVEKLFMNISMTQIYLQIYNYTCFNSEVYFLFFISVLLWHGFIFNLFVSLSNSTSYTLSICQD